MKKLLTILCFMMFGVTIAQTPQAINYQAVATNSSGTPIANSQIGIRISILAGNATGTNVYTEIHTTTTSANGIFNVEIGRGNVQNGNFPNIQWHAQPHFAKIDIDVNGGTNYQTIGTTQFLSVPYALFAENVAMIFKVNDLIVDSSGYSSMNFRNDTLYINQGESFAYDKYMNGLIEWLGGEPENIIITASGLNSNIKIEVEGVAFPATFRVDDLGNTFCTLSVSNTTPVGIYPITITATNPRGRSKSNTQYINVLSCNVSTENDFVGTYYGHFPISVSSIPIGITDTILIINPINNDNLVTINSSVLGNVVCTKVGNTFTGNFSNINKTINLGGIIGEVTVSNFSGQITGTLCNGILNVTISPTSGTATSSYGTLNLGTSKGTYEKQ